MDEEKNVQKYEDLESKYRREEAKYKNNLKRTRLSVTCVETGEVFSSLVEAAEFAKCDTRQLSRAAKSTKGLTAGGYHWIVTPPVVAKLSKRNVRCICMETGEVYNSILEATVATGISKIMDRVYIYEKRYVAGGYHWGTLNYRGQVVRDSLTQHIKAMLEGLFQQAHILCVETGVVYETLAKASASIGLASQINGLRCGKGSTEVIYSNGYHWRRIYPEDFLQYNMVKCVETGLIFLNYSIAAKYYGLVPKTLYYNLTKSIGRVKGGLHFVYYMCCPIVERKYEVLGMTEDLIKIREMNDRRVWRRK